MSGYRHPYKVLPIENDLRSIDKELIVDFTEEKWYVRDTTNTKNVLIETSDISEHIARRDNPHKISFKDVGLALVDNKKQASVENLQEHIDDHDNPHRVTKEQIGLGNVKNIEGVSKEEYNKIIKPVQTQVEKVGQYFESIVDKLGLQKHTLNIITIPENATVKVTYNGYAHEGKTHQLYIGLYDYELSVEGLLPITGKLRMMNGDTTVTLSIAANTLTINTNPEDAKVEVLIEGAWEEGKTHIVKEGNYQYRITREHYEPLFGVAEVKNTSLVLEATLVPIMYTLFLDVMPPGAIIEVEIDGSYKPGDTFKLPFGLYNYRVSKERFKTVEGTAMMDVNRTIPIVLEEAAFKLTVNPTPYDATVEVYYNNTWNVGKVHDLEFGTYQIQLSYPGYRTIAVSVDLTQDTILDLEMEKELYTLSFIPIPIDAIVEVFYDGEWHFGLEHMLINGTYGYKVSKEGYVTKESTVVINNTHITVEAALDVTKYPVKFITTPSDALVEAKIGLTWIPGHTQYLPVGTFEYRVSKQHFITKTDSVVVLEENNPDVLVELEEKIYTVTFVTVPTNTVIDINSQQGYSFQLKAGSYPYSASSTGYTTKTDTLIVEGDMTVELELAPIVYTLTINPDPVDSLVEVFYDDIWNTGNTHSLGNGTYPIRVSKDGYDTIKMDSIIFGNDVTLNIPLVQKTVILNIVVTSLTEPLVEVFYDGIWNVGTTHTFLSGSYDYRVSAPYHDSITGNVEVADNTTLPIALTPVNYTLTINPTPSDATIVIKNINTGIEYTNDTPIPYGMYQYIVSKYLYDTIDENVLLDQDTIVDITIDPSKFKIDFFVFPPDADITVTHLDGTSYTGTGSSHSVLPGMYNYTISMESKVPGMYQDYSGSIEVINQNVEVSQVLTRLLFNLDFVITPETALVEVYYNDTWNSGITHLLHTGLYDYRISETGYATITESIEISSGDETIERTLVAANKQVTFNIIPDSAFVEIRVDGELIEGTTVELPQGDHTYTVTPQELFGVKFNVTPSDSLVEVFYNNKWFSGDIHYLIPGTYDYRISKTGYITTNGQVTVSSSNQTIDVTLTV